MYSVITHTPDETEALGKKIAEKLKGLHFFIALYGDLGAGKTVFVRGLCTVLSPGSKVKSPTYTIVNEYRKGETPLFHFDLYRVENSEELCGFGFEEYVSCGNCIAEWSEHIGDMLPEDAIEVKIRKINETDREITVVGVEMQENY